MQKLFATLGRPMVRGSDYIKEGVVVLCALALVTSAVAQETFGRFSGNPIVELQADGRTIKLHASLEFVDGQNQRWPVPAGFVSDGASIPRGFWTPIGGPLDGAYRDASIVHDYYCEHYNKPWPEAYKRDWQQVHRAFYDGMRARGVSELKAKLMYGAVYYLGPRWEWAGDSVRVVRVLRIGGQNINPEDEVYDYIEKTNPSLEEIEGYIKGIPGTKFERGVWTPARD